MGVKKGGKWKAEEDRGEGEERISEEREEEWRERSREEKRRWGREMRKRRNREEEKGKQRKCGGRSTRRIEVEERKKKNV